jgi:predicted Zn-dependent peptidase
VDFLAERYRPDRLIVSAAGDISHEAVEEWVVRDFGTLDGSASLVDGRPPAPRPGITTTEKALEQVHVCLGVPGVAQVSEERYAAYVLNTVLGGGMSSRLFQEIRERRGHAYAVYSFLSSYRDVGYLGIYVGTSSQWVEDVVTVIAGELDALARDGLQPDELARAKTQLKGNVLLGLETTDSRMSRVAKNEVYHQRDVTIAELSACIDRVTNDNIVALATRLARPEGRALALLGDMGGRRLDPSILTA